MPDAQLFAVRVVDDHFADIIRFLTTEMVSKGYTSQQRKELVVHTADFLVIAGNLYKMGADEILQRYVPNFERDSILAKAHGGATRGHYAGKATLHKDSKAYCKACDVCQSTGRPPQRDELPLHPQVSLQAFEKWVIDFIGPIQPVGKKTGAHYIITSMEYLTKWAEA